MKLSQLVLNNQPFNSISYKSLTPIMKEAVNDIFKLVKNDGNLMFNFENAVDKVAEFHNVKKEDLENYFDKEINENIKGE